MKIGEKQRLNKEILNIRQITMTEIRKEKHISVVSHMLCALDMSFLKFKKSF